jgi:hypothetical protein
LIIRSVSKSGPGSTDVMSPPPPSGTPNFSVMSQTSCRVALPLALSCRNQAEMVCCPDCPARTPVPVGWCCRPSMSVATAVPPTSFEVELEQQPDEEGAAAEAPAERKRLQLTSSSGAAAGMSASVNSRVARGPDGTRGFALQRTDLRRHEPRTRAATAAPGGAGAAPSAADSQWQQQLGNQLYAVVSAIQPDLAGKITGCAAACLPACQPAYLPACHPPARSAAPLGPLGTSLTVSAHG